MGRTRRKPFRKSKAFARSCRNHGTCTVCRGNRTHQHTKAKLAADFRCNRCHRPMLGTTAYDGACECGGLIESTKEDLGA